MFKLEIKKYKTRKNSGSKRAILITLQNPLLKDNMAKVGFYFKNLLAKNWDTVVFIISAPDSGNGKDLLNPYLLKFFQAVSIHISKPVGIVAGELVKKVFTMTGLGDNAVIRGNLPDVLLALEDGS